MLDDWDDGGDVIDEELAILGGYVDISTFRAEDYGCNGRSA